VDFELTDEQKLIQDTVRAFVDDRVLPVAVQNDIDHKLDLDLIEGMAELGILGIVIPEEYGGAGLDFVSRRSPARRSSAARRRSGRSSPSTSG
jgi:alkylation response protein AidB-like acyl-CoA dehydrogenase